MIGFLVVSCLIAIGLIFRLLIRSHPGRSAKPSIHVSPCDPLLRPVTPAAKSQPAQDPNPDWSSVAKSLLQVFPDVVAFADVETTGLHSRDRIVTIAVALMSLKEIEQGKLNISCIHRIYNPGIKCHPDAERIHGHDDWTLRQQPFFVEEAAEVREFIHRAGLICCHNAAFDLAFIDREFLHANLAPIKIPSYCTMTHYRQQYSGSASLANLSAQLGLSRKTKLHGALEDVFLTMNVWLKLNRVSLKIEMPEGEESAFVFQNLRNVPAQPLGTLPPRIRRPKGPPQDSAVVH
jgi:DNA polymerase-3 subunit epsilon